MSWMMIFSYLIFHFFLFVSYFRHRPAFRTEGGILLLHLISVVLLIILEILSCWPSPSQADFAFIIGSTAGHCIYSLTFLEIWALSEGGYSLRVLSEVVKNKHSTIEGLEKHFAALSSGKKEERLDSLLVLGLVQKRQNTFSLTSRGKYLALFIAGICYLSQLDKTG